ncbi:MAG: HAD family hydrolase [Tepidiformaceae bacterium]
MKALLWDLDDTLLETLPGRMRALEHAYEFCLGTRTDALALWRSHRGGTLEALGRRLLGDGFGRFTTAYREHYYAQQRDIRAFAGIEAVLTELAGSGVQMAVVTSKVSWGAIDELGQAGILPHFAAVVGYDDTELHKPDPAPIFSALERLVVDDAADAVFVGDSPADVWAARNAGALSVGALWGTLDEELLRDAMPDRLAVSPADLLSLLAANAHGGMAWK